MLTWPSFLSLQRLSVLCAVLVFVTVFVRGRMNGMAHPLDKLLSKLLAGSAIPTSIFLVVCAFDTTLITKLSDLSLYLAAAGVALLYVSVKEILS
jgi:hypothetical protein